MVANRLPTQPANGNRLRTPAPADQPASTTRLIKTVEHFITSYPQAAIGTAALCGVILGCIIKRR